jgi:hypothetical protein
MKTKELKILIEAAESLGHDDIDIMIDQSRDGQTSYVKATARLERTGDQRDEVVVLVVS